MSPCRPTIQRLRKGYPGKLEDCKKKLPRAGESWWNPARPSVLHVPGSPAPSEARSGLSDYGTASIRSIPALVCSGTTHAFGTKQMSHEAAARWSFVSTGQHDGGRDVSSRNTPSREWREEHHMNILWFIIVGLVVGALAKLIMPGRDGGNILTTILLGIGGALLAGFLGRSMGMYGEGEGAGIIASLIGAILLLAIYRMVRRRSVPAA